MTLETRLATMKRYREEAMKQPLANRLYIEDLDLSIAMFEAQKDKGYPVINGIEMEDG